LTYEPSFQKVVIDVRTLFGSSLRCEFVRDENPLGFSFTGTGCQQNLPLGDRVWVQHGSRSTQHGKRACRVNLGPARLQIGTTRVTRAASTRPDQVETRCDNYCCHCLLHKLISTTGRLDRRAEPPAVGRTDGTQTIARGKKWERPPF
jgi:hypothetical protein